MIPIIPLILSVALHAAVLMLPTSDSSKKKEQQKQEQKAEDGNGPIETRLIPISKSALSKPCAGELYIGVGMKIRFGSVWEVAPGGPAAKAGIQPGDFIEGYETIRNKYPKGHLIILNATRGSSPLVFKVTTEEICSE